LGLSAKVKTFVCQESGKYSGRLGKSAKEKYSAQQGVKAISKTEFLQNSYTFGILVKIKKGFCCFAAYCSYTRTVGNKLKKSPMIKGIEKKLKININILKGIGILEIVGGITGIGLIIWLTLQGMETNTYVFLILLVAIGFYIYSIYAGTKLFKHKENGILHSRILQYLQLIAISIGGMTYLLTSGGNFFLGYNFTNSTLEFKISVISSEFQINIMSSEQNDVVYINIMAIAILLLLEKAVSKIKELNLSKENYENNMKEYLATQKNEV